MKMRNFAWLASVAALLVCAPGSVFAACKQRQIAALDVEIVDGAVILPAKVNGRDVRVMLGLAQGIPIMFRQAAKELGLEVVPQTDRQTVSGERLDKVLVNSVKLGPAEFAGWNMYVQRESEGSWESSPGAPLIGIITSSFMTSVDMELNLAEKKVILFDQTKLTCGASVVYWQGAVTAMSLGLDGSGLMVFPLEIQGKSIEAALDTLNSESAISELVTTKYLGFNHDSPGVIKQTKANGAGTDSYRAMSLTAKNLSMQDVRVRLNDDMHVKSSCSMRKFGRASLMGGEVRYSDSAIGFEGCQSVAPVSVGTDLLRKLRIYMASGQGKIYFTRVDPPAQELPAAPPPTRSRPSPR